MRTLPALAAAATLLLTTLGTTVPAHAHGDNERNREMRTQLLAEGDNPLMSGNVALQSTHPGTVGIAGCFMETAPLFVTSGLEALTVWDASDPTKPTRTGVLANVVFENEAMNCGERRTKKGVRRFALIGIDLYNAAADSNGIAHVSGEANQLLLVDVTDPSDPKLLGPEEDPGVPSTTGTHTVACIAETNCRYAYTSGEKNTFSIFDLRNLDKPREIDSDPGKEGIQPFSSPTGGHKWNFDEAGYGVHTGYDGSSVFDVSKPREPRLVTTSGAAGRGEDPKAEGYNDFIHHNSYRPSASEFREGRRPSVDKGNVLLVTEEDYIETDCNKAGSFQTWQVNSLRPGGEELSPLDKVELGDLHAEQGMNLDLPQGAFCSAHWFDYRPGGIVAIGYYGGGTQFLDVRDPRDIKSFGYAYMGGSEVWDAMWVPVYNGKGRQTGAKTNIVYSIDLVRGLDVYSVDVPGKVGIEPMSGTGPQHSAADLAAAAALPAGLVAGALGLAAAVRRRARRQA
ncbi:hypothetical protein [Nocardioides coralli]|uniref:hypothetical protein n=1 Tax=Nocardioides coralli TaxID=2872154 RepID=UPI001CA45C8C|nr:hypothetical protein [Nocardioides coralli]QZY28161.1 hypothetical protein K6T13_11770 [Nocardioides coralli]